MMVSILIPTYNYNARALVVSMHQLSQAEGVEAEVLVGDDASTAETAWMDEVGQESTLPVSWGGQASATCWPVSPTGSGCSLLMPTPWCPQTFH